MTAKEYVFSIKDLMVDSKKVKRIVKKYGFELNEELAKIVSNCEEGIFFDDEKRILSFSEIMDAEKDLKIKFKKLKMLPIMDCIDNNFITYSFDNDNWVLFNIEDEIAFKESVNLLDLL